MANNMQKAPTRFLLKLAFVAALLLSAGSLPAAMAEGGPETPGWWSNTRVVEKMRLTEEQISRIEGLIYDSSGLMIDLRAQLSKSALALDRLLRADELDDGKVQAHIDLIADSKCAIEREKLNVRFAVAKVLNADQRTQLRDFLERAKRKRQERREGIEQLKQERRRRR